ncbi:GIY-YIG nuclease family protein [Haloferula chungangensis]|uniref:GIY-YIG nuclease family protein n=1 Tax=Haloferula chungangensis TaxID=1048331 RepID=A0ABW2L2P0_9BACT
MFYAYIIRSEMDYSKFYYGSTDNLRRRIRDHNSGKNLTTKDSKPWKLIWYGGFANEGEAREFERYLKTASGKAFARKRLISDFV